MNIVACILCIIGMILCIKEMCRSYIQNNSSFVFYLCWLLILGILLVIGVIQATI